MRVLVCEYSTVCLMMFNGMKNAEYFCNRIVHGLALMNLTYITIGHQALLLLPCHCEMLAAALKTAFIKLHIALRAVEINAV